MNGDGRGRGRNRDDDSEPTEAAPSGDRLQKILAAAGFGSRRSCEELITQGRVKVNGRVAQLGDRAVAGTDHISVDGVPVRNAGRTVVYLLYKPRGYVTTVNDPEGRPTVMDLVPSEPRVFPVGRLDRDTEGLLLLTNDGDLAQTIAHPKHHLDKTYVVDVSGVVGERALRRLTEGVELDDGRARCVSARVVGQRKASTLLELKLSMGRNRVVRRMCEAVGHPVRRLVRTAIGPLRDPDIPEGHWRPLNDKEIRMLEAAALTKPARKGPPRGGRKRSDPATGTRRGADPADRRGRR